MKQELKTTRQDTLCPYLAAACLYAARRTRREAPLTPYRPFAWRGLFGELT